MKSQTDTAKLLSQRTNRKGILVPLLEDLFHAPVEIEDEHDVAFMTKLLERMVVRQDARTNRPLFSPSQLATCLRHVYLLKHWQELGIEKKRSVRIQPNFYFFKGNFLHLQWQFALHKLDKKLPNEVFKLIGIEVPIISKRQDHGGTVDAIVLIYDEPYIVDFKGLNVRTFSEITRGYVPHDYLVQLSDYGMLFNSILKKKGVPRISKALLVVENKGGPDPKYVIALHETPIEIATYLPEVRLRLEALREHGEEKEIPPPECTSPYIVQFTGCPFRGFCKKEVTEIHRERKRIADSESSEVEVARPTRTARKRRKRVAKA